MRGTLTVAVPDMHVVSLTDFKSGCVVVAPQSPSTRVPSPDDSKSRQPPKKAQSLVAESGLLRTRLGFPHTCTHVASHLQGHNTSFVFRAIPSSQQQQQQQQRPAEIYDMTDKARRNLEIYSAETSNPCWPGRT
ncbi:hypothetical protein VTL71DRAFT_9520 [Oculimacula yallundae]|uniref:Uncharacterized protein n=1 Tax=Oculimacula yallundae TaxID=86028 RepID=A0ABR4BS67_9HELO